MKTRAALALWLLILVPADFVSAAPNAAPHFLAQLVGRWQLGGTVMGKPVHYRAAGRWVMNAGWLEFSMVDVTTPPTYEARVYLGYDAKTGDYIAHWLDRFGAAGARVVATGKEHGHSLVLLFPYAEGAFRDTLTLAPDGTSGTLLLEAQQPDGGWARFAYYQMTRSAPARAPHEAQ